MVCTIHSFFSLAHGGLGVIGAHDMLWMVWLSDRGVEKMMLDRSAGGGMNVEMRRCGESRSRCPQCGV
jgi:hypothetical protein